MLKLYSALIVAALAFATVQLDASPSSAAPALTPRTSDVAGVRVV
jgi:hypothetical protein